LEIGTEMEPLEDILSSPTATGEEPRPKRLKQLSPREAVCVEIEEAMASLAQRRAILKKIKLPLPKLIVQEYPKELREVALILAALPPTQVSVERLFSSLKILKSDLKNRVGEKLLNAKLFLRANSNMGICSAHTLRRT